MKMPLNAEFLEEAGPERLRIRRGGGCLSLFGVPFLAAGVFVSLIALGVLVPENAEDLPWWAWPVMLAMGLGFVAVGGHLVFGRTWIVMDRSRGVVSREWGLLVPLKSEELSLQSYSAVVLRFDAGDSDTPDRYPVALQAQAGGADLPLLSGAGYAAARAHAERVSAFLRMPLIDSTTDHESILHPEMLSSAFQERVRQEPPSREAPPQTLRASVEESGRTLRILIPGPGAKPALLLQLAIPLGFAAFALAQLIPFFEETNTPAPVEWVFIAFLALFVIGPVASGVLSLIRAKGTRTEVTVSPSGITIVERGPVRAKTADLPIDSILEIDYGTRASRMESAKRETTAARAAEFSRGGGGVYGTAQLPGWLAFLASLVPSKGVILKTRKGVFTFGGGLPDDEVKYLHERVRRAVAA